MKKIIILFVLLFLAVSNSYAYAHTKVSAKAKISIKNKVTLVHRYNKSHFFILAGSIANGTVINNVHCIVAKKKKFGYPVLISINSILFSKYKLFSNKNKNIEKIYLIGEAYGSSFNRRIYIHGKFLNCILKNGKSVYRRVNFFVVDKGDNKFGIIAKNIEQSKKSKIIKDFTIKAGRKIIIIFTKNIFI